MNALASNLGLREAPGFTSLFRTHLGRVRQVNEDRVLDRADRALWAVADGMGGHRGGDIAAEIAIAALRALADDTAPITPTAIKVALECANRLILERAAQAGGVIGSTVVVLQVTDGVAHLCWAGDSRAYRADSNIWMQLTKDHSVVQELVDKGLIDQVQADQHPRGHVITRALGIESAVEIDYLSFPITSGETLLLCSDGLSRTLDRRSPSIADEDAADDILSQALERDGTDNISFVLISAP